MQTNRMRSKLVWRVKKHKQDANIDVVTECFIKHLKQPRIFVVYQSETIYKSYLVCANKSHCCAFSYAKHLFVLCLLIARLV